MTVLAFAITVTESGATSGSYWELVRTQISSGKQRKSEKEDLKGDERMTWGGWK